MLLNPDKNIHQHESIVDQHVRDTRHPKAPGRGTVRCDLFVDTIERRNAESAYLEHSWSTNEHGRVRGFQSKLGCVERDLEARFLRSKVIATYLCTQQVKIHTSVDKSRFGEQQ